MNKLASLLKSFNISYKNIALYEQALTHPSYNGDANTKHQDYEKLEFGKRPEVLAIAVALFPHHS